MFVGKYEINIDKKRRIVVPRLFKKQIGDTELFVISNDNWLSIMSKSDVINYLLSVESEMTPKEIISYERNVFQRMRETKLDKQGRMLIPFHMAETVGLTDRATVVGVNNRIEIWEPKTWKNVQDHEMEILAGIPQNVLSLRP